MVRELSNRPLRVVITVAAPRIRHHANVVGVLTGNGVSVGPFEALNTSKNRGSVARSEGDELAALGDTGPTTCRGVAVPCDGSTDVRAVARGGVGVSRLDPFVVGRRPLCRIERFLAGPRFEVVVVGVTRIHAGVEVDDGGAVAVPFAEREVDLPKNLTAWSDDHTVPCVGCTDDVGGLVHHDTGVGLAAPIGRQVEEFQRLVEFKVFHAVPRRHPTNVDGFPFNQPPVDTGSIAQHVQPEVAHEGQVVGGHR